MWGVGRQRVWGRAGWLLTLRMPLPPPPQLALSMTG